MTWKDIAYFAPEALIDGKNRPTRKRFRLWVGLLPFSELHPPCAAILSEGKKEFMGIF